MAVGRAVDVKRAQHGSVEPRVASRKFSGHEVRVASENVEDGRIERPRAQNRTFLGDQVGQALDDEKDDLLVRVTVAFASRSFLAAAAVVVAIVNDELGQALFVHHHQMAIDFLQNYDILQWYKMMK